MKIVIATDANGEEYEAYEGQTRSGEPVHVDKQLADLTGDPESMLASEIQAYEDAETSPQGNAAATKGKEP